MNPLFILDTSLFINGWTKFYAPSVFPGVWSAIDNSMASGGTISCQDVYEEIIAKDDAISAWAKSRKPFFEKPTEQCLLKLREVMTAFPNYVAAGGAKNKADPMIIAHALITDTTVVTFEQPQATCSPTKSPKMPLVCEHFGVNWMTPCSYLEAIGLVLK